MPCLFFLVKLGNKRHSFCSHPLGKAGIIWPCTNSRGSWIGGWPSLLMGWCELCYVGEPGDAFAVWYLSMRIGALHYQPEQPPRAFYFRIERFLKHYYTTFTVIKYHLTLHKVYYLTPFCWNYRIFSVLCHHRVFHEYTSFFNLRRRSSEDEFPEPGLLGQKGVWTFYALSFCSKLVSEKAVTNWSPKEMCILLYKCGWETISHILVGRIFSAFRVWLEITQDKTWV